MRNIGWYLNQVAIAKVPHHIAARLACGEPDLSGEYEVELHRAVHIATPQRTRARHENIKARGSDLLIVYLAPCVAQDGGHRDLRMPGGWVIELPSHLSRHLRLRACRGGVISNRPAAAHEEKEARERQP
eukprot:CAMPEP_0179874982 /NCGR_PEP_ID=MMETSP0982-20121206/23229_1 /TAXON_ID=483367 /ORGANISM="non described non described, Strain CCMP 2436" /LENGTH=129 /DNA_ID=CAMNT_0021766915 /DNA_START=277 /DNA_END=666 /DNA_ORIENTATION=+